MRAALAPPKARLPSRPSSLRWKVTPEVLEVEQLLGRLAAHDLDRVLVAQVVRALDGVEGVRLPGVLRVERRVDAALGRVRVRAHRVDLGDDAHGCALLRGGEGGALAGEAGSDDEDVVLGHSVGRARFYGTYDRAGLSGARRAPPSAQRAAHGLDRHDAAQHAVAVHRHHRAQARQPLAAEQRLERVLDAARRPLSPSSRAITDATARVLRSRSGTLVDRLAA